MMKPQTKIKIKLHDIAEAISSQWDEMTEYLNKKTGEIVCVQNETMVLVENGDPEAEENYAWEKEELDEARKIYAEPDNYLALPDKFEIHEYKIMENFCLLQSDEEMRDELCYAIKGSGAFRRFKSLIYQLGIADDWYRFRDKAYESIAREWCEENDIEVV